MLKLDNEKAWIPSKNSEGSASSVRDSSQGKDTKRSLDKRLSPFELEESAAYEIYYIGPRRIYSRS